LSDVERGVPVATRSSHISHCVRQKPGTVYVAADAAAFSPQPTSENQLRSPAASSDDLLNETSVSIDRVVFGQSPSGVASDVAAVSAVGAEASEAKSRVRRSGNSGLPPPRDHAPAIAPRFRASPQRLAWRLRPL